ncbi:MAG: hypothetical protein ACF8K1_01230 [Phycisphaerales bacterium JB047]
MMKNTAAKMTLLFLLLSTMCVAPLGCSEKSKEEQAAEELIDQIDEIGRQNREELQSELEDDGGYSMRTERVDKLVDAYENSSEDLPDALKAQMADQVEALKDIKALAQPYELAYNAFTELGGLDPTTMTDEADIQKRINLVNTLIDENEKIDAGFPEILPRLGGDPAEIEQQLDLVKKIRQTDREMLPHMREVLVILKKHWAISEMGDDDMFYFGYDVPDEDIDLYNEHIELMNVAALEQERLQRLQLQMMQP